MDVSKVLYWILIGAFILFSLIELIFAFFEKETPRKITKPFCVATLACIAGIVAPSHWLIAAGLALGALGDLLLIFKHKVMPFVLGTFCFFLNHICFIAEYLLILGTLPWYIHLVLGLALVGVLAGGYPLMHKAIKTPALAGGGVIYLASIVMDFALAIVACIYKMYPFGLFCVFGMASFVVSDAYLVKTLFIKDDKRRDFYIMATYLLAQAFILFGFCLYLGVI